MRPRQREAEGGEAGPAAQLVTMTLAGQEIGIPVAVVQDILGPQRVTPVPLAGPEVAGVLNLRGRIVTAIDLRVRLGLAEHPDREAAMNVVIEHQGELYSLLVDQVGEVLSARAGELEHDLSLLGPAWRERAGSILPCRDHVLVILDVARVLAFGMPA